MQAAPPYALQYEVDFDLSQSRVPQVAMLDGLVMGGGVGISIHGCFRVATERTVWAMPEVKIGLFPDIGASYFMSRMPDEIGTYLGMTGRSVNGRDALGLGIATHFVPSAMLPALREKLFALPRPTKDAIAGVLDDAQRVTRCCFPATAPTALFVRLTEHPCHQSLSFRRCRRVRRCCGVSLGPCRHLGK